jgi:iron complex outermembrane recepter protein
MTPTVPNSANLSRARRALPLLRRLPPFLLCLVASSLGAQPAATTPPARTTPPAAGSAPAANATAPGAAPEVVLDQMVVTGVRGSLIGAQELKQNAVQFVDSIVAQDIGKLPDNTVADALQRVPGIQVARDNGEVNSVVIRGLPNLATTLNSHEIFTGTGRGVALQDIPAELVAGVDVYKSNAPDQIEGGIAGLIDIRLRRPLDFEGLTFSAGGRLIFPEHADENTWIASAMVSNRWKLANGGEVGALVAVADQTYHFKDQRVFNFLWTPLNTAAVPGQTAIVLPDTVGSLLVPGERERPAVAFSAQWRPHAGLELYSDFLFTGYRNKRQVHFFIGLPRTFASIESVVLNPGTNVVSRLVSRNNFHLNSTQAFQDRTDSYQAVAGAKWTSGPIRATTEFVYNWSSFKNRGVIVDIQYVAPSTFTFDLNPSSGSNVTVTGGDITDVNNYRLWGLFDNRGYQTSDQLGWKADVEYTLPQGILNRIKGGIRLTERDARSRQSSNNNLAPTAGRGVPTAASIPGFGSKAPDGLFSKSEFGASNWYGPDPDFLRDSTNTIRPIFGRPAQEADFNPTQAFTDTESTYAGYVQANYTLGPSDRPLTGLIGARVVKTEQELQGNLTNGTPVNGGKDTVDVLPTLNGRLKLMENLLFRFSVGRAITRPGFAQLNPVVTLNAPTTTGGANGTGNGGNPDLDNVKSDNYDVSLEYYFAPASYVSVTGFYRTIKGYVQTFAALETVGGTNYIVTRPRNGGRGHLDGIEATYQHFPDFFPGWLKGLGWQTNYTFIEGEQDVALAGGAVGARVKQPYAQVSKHSYNLIGIYERGPFSLRVAYNRRGKYVDTFNGPNPPGNPLRTITVKANDRLDANVSYRFGRGLTFTLDATNLLDSEYQDYFGPDAQLHPRDTRLFDRTIELGVRYRF